MSTEESAVENSSKGADANLTRQGSVVAGMTLLSRISGFARDIVLSYLFGATQLADMFFVALRIPNFFRRLFAEGAFNQAFVPVLVRFKENGRAQLLGFLAPLSGLFSLIMLFVVLAGVVFAPALTAVFAPGFLDNEAQFAQTADLVRITFPYLGFISIAAYAGAVLNAHNRFAMPAFAPVLLNVSLIGSALFALSGWALAEGQTAVQWVAWGVALAGVLQMGFLLVPVRRLGLLPKPGLDRQHPGVRQVGKLLVPAVFSASVGQINALVNTILASTLMTGSISWLYYADRLMELPLGLVAVALGTVMLPHLSRLAAAEDTSGFSKTVEWGIQMGLLIGLPAAVALYLLAEPLSATVFMSFGSGAMTLHDIRMIGLALELFAVALPGFV
ncbi:MAG: murein biosynthesis integral membrane protein MurJ, partial [Pseudomonadota bacterium]